MANSNATNSYLETFTAPSLEHKKTYRIRGIPLEYKKIHVEQLLQSVLKLDGAQDAVQVKSLAMSPNYKTKMATVDFRTLPAGLSSSSNEWHFDILVL